MLDLAGRVVMVSGAGRGIGRAIACHLHTRGVKLSLGLRSPQVLADHGFEAHLIHPYDARDRTSAETWVEATRAHFGVIHGLVNNAGELRPAAIEDDDEAFLRLFEINALGPLRLIRAALPHLRETGSGRLINVVSLSGKRVRNDNAGYAMSKFAALALSHAARRAGWDAGVRTTAICPGFVATDMASQITSTAQDEMTQPEDLAATVATLLALPNTASVAEILINCRHEDML